MRQWVLTLSYRLRYDAATLGGAPFLGRADLGRLRPGAKAHIVVVDLVLAHNGAVHDLIEAG